MLPDSASRPNEPIPQVLVLIPTDTDIEKWQANILNIAIGLQKVGKLVDSAAAEESGCNGVWLGLSFSSNTEAEHFMQAQTATSINAIRIEWQAEQPFSKESMELAESASSSSNESAESGVTNDLASPSKRANSQARRETLKATPKQFHLEGPTELLRVICAHLKYFISCLVETTPETEMDATQLEDLANLRNQFDRLSSLRQGGLSQVSLLDHHTLTRSFGAHMATLSRARGDQLGRQLAPIHDPSSSTVASNTTASSSDISRLTDTEEQRGRPRSKSTASSRPRIASILDHFSSPPGTPILASLNYQSDSPQSARSENGQVRALQFSSDVPVASSSFSDTSSYSTASLHHAEASEHTKDMSDEDIVTSKQPVHGNGVHSQSAANLSKVRKHTLLRSDTVPTVLSAAKEKQSPSPSPSPKPAKEKSPGKEKIHRKPSKPPNQSITREPTVIAQPPPQDANSLAQHDAIYQTMTKKDRQVLRPLCAETPPATHFVPNFHIFSFPEEMRTASEREAVPIDLEQEKEYCIQEEAPPVVVNDDLVHPAELIIQAPTRPTPAPNHVSVHLLEDFSKASVLMEYVLGMAWSTYKPVLKSKDMIASALSRADMHAKHQFGGQRFVSWELRQNLPDTALATANAYVWTPRIFSLREFSWGVYWMLFTRFVEHLGMSPGLQRATTVVDLGDLISPSASSSASSASSASSLHRNTPIYSPHPTAADFANLELLWVENVELLRELANCRELRHQKQWNFDLDFQVPLTEPDHVVKDWVHKSLKTNLPELRSLKSPRSDNPTSSLPLNEAQFFSSTLCQSIVDMNLRTRLQRLKLQRLGTALGLRSSQFTLSYPDAITGAMNVLHDNGSTCTLL
jgi:hypothetical protein